MVQYVKHFSCNYWIGFRIRKILRPARVETPMIKMLYAVRATEYANRLTRLLSKFHTKRNRTFVGKMPASCEKKTRASSLFENLQILRLRRSGSRVRINLVSGGTCRKNLAIKISCGSKPSAHFLVVIVWLKLAIPSKNRPKPCVI